MSIPSERQDPILDKTRGVLVAGADEEFRVRLQSVLQEAGFPTLLAASTEQAEAIARERKPRLVVVQWAEEAQFSAREACARIRAIDTVHRFHLLATSFQPHPRLMAEAFALGVDDFIWNPAESAEVLARVRNGRRMLDLESELVRASLQDPLTGVATRRAFDDALAREWSNFERYDAPLSCVFVDVDYFKLVNDQHGHDVGDQVLRQVAALLRESARDCDQVFRFGGEEFVVLLPNTDSQGSTVWAERARKRIAAHPFHAGGTELMVTASFGLAEANSCMERVEELIQAADQCLLTAKKWGRNCVINMLDVAADASSALLGFSSSGDRPFEAIPLSEAMSPLIHCLTPSMSLTEAADYLRNFRISSAPVVGSEGELLGIVSEKDILVLAHKPEASARKVNSVMRRSVVSFEQEVPLVEVLGLLQQTHYRSVVVTADGQPTGVATRSSLLAWCAQHLWQDDHLPTDRLDGLPVQGVLASVTELIATARRLRDDVSGNRQDDPAVVLVAGATKIQDFVQDLLAAAPAFSQQPGASR